jgi:D-glucosaminate-6-phosphate ammonia-lyase
VTEPLSERVYEKLDVPPIINALGTVTVLGGSRMEPATLEAMTQAAAHFASLPEVLRKASAYTAELAGVEATCITSGALAAFTVSVADRMTGLEGEAIRRLPNTAGVKCEVIVLRSQQTESWQSIALSDEG